MAGTELSADNKLTLVDIAKSKAPNGTHIPVIEMLHQKNAVLDDWVWQEANGVSFHKISRRSSLGDGGNWRELNNGVPITSTKKVSANETMGILEDYAESDIWIVDNAADPLMERMEQSRGIVEGMSQTLANTIIYGNASLDPTQFTGLAPRLDTLAQINVYGGGNASASTNTSIYAAAWGRGRTTMIFPKGSPTQGVKHTDKGQQTQTKATTGLAETNQMEIYRDHFVVNAGMSVEDTRYIGRYCNINSTVGGANSFNEDLLIQMLDEFPDEGLSAVLYVNKTMFSQMKIRLKDKSNVFFSMENGFGPRKILTFQGIPIRKVEKISNTEAVVV